MRKSEEVALFGNLTAMIDVVFQIIIFFVCTAKMQDSALDTRIKLAMAPHGMAVGKKDPLEIVVDVSSRGGISIARTPLTPALLGNVIRKAVGDYGSQVPVVIRGDSKSSHTMIRTVMDTCAANGVWKIKIAAMKERGG
jgi:biopolymer transport protein ExbD